MSVAARPASRDNGRDSSRPDIAGRGQEGSPIRQILRGLADRRALRLARRSAGVGDHVAALAGPGARSPEILHRLGLFQSAAAATPATRADRLAIAMSLAQCGACEEALAVLAQIWPKPWPRERVAFALALARWEPERAFGLLPAGARLERAALALSLDWPGLAGELLREVDPAANATEFLALSASLATRGGDHRLARVRANALFARQGLEAGFDEARDAPLSLEDFRPPAPPPRDGPLVSVVMPARDAAATVAFAVRSALGQSWRALELILVDDASRDDTRAVATQAAAGDPRFRALVNSSRRGAYGARNRGVLAARGEFIAFADADDVAHPRRIADALRALAARPAAQGHLSRLVRLDPARGFVAPRLFPLVRRNPSSLVVRRAPALERLGLFEEVETGADGEFIGRLVACFGPRALIADRRLYAIAGAAPGSLTADPRTGIASREANLARLAYREAWHWRHARDPLEGAPAIAARRPGEQDR